MVNFSKHALHFLITVGFLNAEPLEQMGQKDGYDVKLTSEKLNLLLEIMTFL